MKKQTKKLQLNKEIVAKLNDDSMRQVRGGALANANGRPKAGFWTFDGNCTGGCTDGCGPYNTAWNCTKTQCTADCNTKTIGTQSKMTTCHTFTCDCYTYICH